MGLPDCRIVNDAVAPALLIVTVAERSSAVSFAWTVTFIVTSPDEPEEGERVTQPDPPE